jgi:hypothetical protein
LFTQFSQVHRLFASCDYQDKTPGFFVAQKQVFGADGWLLRAVLLGFGTGEDCRVFNAFIGQRVLVHKNQKGVFHLS